MVLCPRCQAAFAQTEPPKILTPLPPITASAATGTHEGTLREAVHSLKYQNARSISLALGARLAECLRQLAWPVDAIVPVPLHSSRISERGYNQALVLGAYVAAQHSLPLLPEAMIRWRSTVSQVGLNPEQRRANVTGAFSSVPAYVNSKSILLIDDVYTTGATLQACAQAALDSGALAVYSLTVTAARV